MGKQARIRRERWYLRRIDPDGFSETPAWVWHLLMVLAMCLAPILEYVLPMGLFVGLLMLVVAYPILLKVYVGLLIAACIVGVVHHHLPWRFCRAR